MKKLVLVLCLCLSSLTFAQQGLSNNLELTNLVIKPTTEAFDVEQLSAFTGTFYPKNCDARKFFPLQFSDVFWATATDGENTAVGIDISGGQYFLGSIEMDAKSVTTLPNQGPGSLTGVTQTGKYIIKTSLNGSTLTVFTRKMSEDNTTVYNLDESGNSLTVTVKNSFNQVTGTCQYQRRD
ncbi:MAG TPA: hypothetical protein PKC21_06695 [Oligoflexia bacterium]|nr:hypothetical protein [Oligoflexia bacterium]HMR25024.1 hypothetical protein [Oligoflexia bacterium]